MTSVQDSQARSRLEGRRAVVTAGRSGIYRAIALSLAADGAAVPVIDVTTARKATALIGDPLPEALATYGTIRRDVRFYCEPGLARR